MLIYLDQNKWIALARMVYGKDKSHLSKSIVENTLKAVEDGRITILLSVYTRRFRKRYTKNY